jgi:predicted PurR-regulated permease PerM
MNTLTHERPDRGATRVRARHRRTAPTWRGRSDDAAPSAPDQCTGGRECVEVAVSAAVQAGLSPEALLLDEDERRVAAGANEDQPFGHPSPSSGAGPLGTGFAAAAGALLAILLAYALATVRHELILILIAAFVAIGLDPAVKFLERRGASRRLAVTVVCLAVLALLVGFIVTVAAPLRGEATSLIHAAPGYLDQLKDRNSTLGRLNAQLHLSDKAKSLADHGFGLQSASSVLSVGSAVATGVFDTIVVLVLIVYFLADLPRITAAAYRLAPRHRRPRVGLLCDEIIKRVGGYVLGNVATSFITFAVSFPALLLLRVPYALVLAVLMGVLDLVPLVGSTIAGGIAALVALGGVGVSAALGVIVFALVYRLIADYVINPPIMRRTVDVSPLVTIVAVVIGGALLGIVGALVAVPAAAAIQLLLTEVLYPIRDEQIVP